jgi:hypothetical protein
MKKFGVIKSNRLWSLEGFLNCKKDVSVGDRVLIPAFTVPKCEIPGEKIMKFSEKHIKSDEAIVINKTEKEIHLIFDHCLFQSAIDFNKQSDFSKTQLAAYLQTEFLKSLNAHGVPAITCDLPSMEEVFSENRLDFFKSGKNRIGFAFDEESSVWYWLKDVASAWAFCGVDYDGNADYTGASTSSVFVRPRFVIAA